MKRIRPIVIVVAVIVLGGSAFAILRDREPRYQGRTLSEWIESAQVGFEKLDRKYMVIPAHPEEHTNWLAASNAVKHIGTNAFSLLLGWVQAKDSPVKTRVIDWLDEHPSCHLRIKAALDYHTKAYVGFRLLGGEAKPVQPILIKTIYTANWEQKFAALDAILATQPDKETLLPVLLRLYRDQDNHVQYVGAFELHLQYPQDAEAAGVYKMFPQLRKEPTNQSTTNQPPTK